jgi:hypothetical protein
MVSGPTLISVTGAVSPTPVSLIRGMCSSGSRGIGDTEGRSVLPQLGQTNVSAESCLPHISQKGVVVPSEKGLAVPA